MWYNLTMHTINFIKEHGLEALASLGIEVKDYGDFVLLNYDQIESPKHHPVVNECRGLILAKGTWEVLCRSFDRFYNYGEDPKSNEFPIDQATVTEKIDGSLIRIWYNPFTQKWCAATRKMAFCEGETPCGVKFIDIVERVIGDVHNYMVASKHNYRVHRCFTFIFELVSPETRVVKPYGETMLYRLAVRENESGEYAGFHELGGLFAHSEFPGTKLPKRYYFTNVKDCMESMAELPAMDEGYVANYHNWRIKIKNPAYLAIAHLRNNGAMSLPRIVHLVWSGDEEEYLSYFAEDRPLFEPWIYRRDVLKTAVADMWARFNGIEMSQKDFALAIKDLPYASLLFQLRKGKTLHDIFKELGEKGRDGRAAKSLVRMLENVSA